MWQSMVLRRSYVAVLDTVTNAQVAVIGDSDTWWSSLLEKRNIKAEWLSFVFLQGVFIYRYIRIIYIVWGCFAPKYSVLQEIHCKWQINSFSSACKMIIKRKKYKIFLNFKIFHTRNGL